MLCVFENFITDRTLQSAEAGIRASIFNRCNDVTMRTREVLLVLASCDVIILSRRGDGGKLAQILRFIYLCLLSHSFMKSQFLIDRPIYISLDI